MTHITSEPWFHPDPAQSQLRLVEVPRWLLQAFATGQTKTVDSEWATPYPAGSDCSGLWRMRSRQLAETPSDGPWVTRLVIVPGTERPVGLAGFHGAPDNAGMVEIGYRIDPQHRRLGYARQALETLLSVAENHPEVSVVRATVSPHNTASRALVDAYGFIEVGEQWDQEDGLEVILEVPKPPLYPA